MLNIYTLLDELVACPSISPDDAHCQEIIIKLLTQWDYQIHPLPYKQAKNLWATPKNHHKPRLIWAGHTDVVSVGNSADWLHPPFAATRDGAYIYGRGVADMKGGLAAMLVAVEKFRYAYPKHAHDIGFLITSAEEGPSELGTPIVLQYLNEQNITFDWCVVGEPSCEQQLGDTIKNGRRGSLTGLLTIQGKQGHIAYPALAANPIHLFAAFLADFTQQQWDQGNEFFQPTQMQISNLNAGTGAGNVIPGQLQMLFNFRYSPMVTAEELMEKTNQLLQSYKLNYAMDWTHYGEPFLTQPNDLTNKLSKAIQEVCGIQPKLSTTGGTSDARYIAKTGAQVVEFGLCNGSIHQINERILEQDLIKLADIYYQFLCNMLVL